MVRLVGKAIILRELDYADWVSVHRYASLKEVCQFQPWGPNSIEETKSYVEECLIDAKKPLRTRYVLGAINKENQQMIGAGEFNIREEFNREGEIGYILHPYEWGKGFATEIASLLVDFGFKSFHLHRIFATCDLRNIGSYRVLEKIGMTRDRLLREHILLRDGWRDSLLYSILENKWRSLKQVDQVK